MGRLRRQAHAQAAAEAGPQKRTVRRQTHAEVRSIRSMQPALEQGIESAETQLKHSNLTGRDLQIALGELARRNLDVAGSTALQVGEAQREGQQELVDLSQAQGQQEASILAQLQSAALERRQGIHDEIAGEQRSMFNEIKQKALEEQLGLGDSGGGLTPTQHRAAQAEHHSAAYWAKQYISAAKDGIKDEDEKSETYGKYLIPPHPANWDDSVWQGLVGKVQSAKGVNNVDAAQRAVDAVRDHFQPSRNASAFDLLKKVANPTIQAFTPQPIPQFADALLRGR